MNQPAGHAPLLYVAGKFVGLGLAPVAVIVLPGLLGEAAYGKYSYWVGLIAVYMVMLDLGGQSVLRRYLPQMIQQTPQQAGRLFWITQRLKIVPLILLGSALFFGGESSTSLYLVCAALLAALSNSCADIYYAYQQMGRHSIAILSRRFFRLVLVPTFFLSWELPGIIAALLVSELLGLIISAPALNKLPRASQPLALSYAKYYQQGFLLFLSFLVATTATRLPVFMSEWTDISAQQVGQIALCVDITYFALRELINALTESIYPKLIQQHAAKKHEAFGTLAALNFRIVNFTALGVSAIGIGLAPGFLALLGGEFYLAEAELKLILLTLIFTCWNNLHGYLQMIEGHGKQILVAQLIGIMINLVCIGIFWQQQTIFTLTIALTAGMISAALVSYLDARRLFRHESSTPYFLRLLPAAILVSLALQLLHPRGLLNVFIAGMLACIIYFLLAVLSRGLPKEDLRLIITTVRQRRS